MKQKREDLRKIPKTIKTHTKRQRVFFCAIFRPRRFFLSFKGHSYPGCTTHLKVNKKKELISRRVIFSWFFCISNAQFVENWHLIRGLKHRQKKMVRVKGRGMVASFFHKPFFNSLVDPMSSRAGSIQPHFLKQV